MRGVFGLAATAAFLCCLAQSPALADQNQRMIDRMIGKWGGTGQLTYTKTWTFPFRCKIEGRPGPVSAQVDLLGRCWAGPIWSRMGAALRYNRKTRSYIGKFRDGTNTFVIDIAGRREGRGMDLDLRQGKQRGALGLKFNSDDELRLTIAVVNPKTQARRKVVDLTLERQPTELSANIR